MIKNLIKFLFLAVYAATAASLLFLHGYFIYNSQSFSLTNYYWWLLTPGLIWIIWRRRLPFKLLFLTGFITFILGGAVRVFSAFGETLINLGLVVIILSIFKARD